MKNYREIEKCCLTCKHCNIDDATDVYSRTCTCQNASQDDIKREWPMLGKIMDEDCDPDQTPDERLAIRLEFGPQVNENGVCDTWEKR